MQDQQPNIRILVYGYMKKYAFQYRKVIDQYGEESIKYLRTVQLPGLKMFNSGSNPVAMRSRINFETKIPCELMEVTQEVYVFYEAIQKALGLHADSFLLIDGQAIIHLKDSVKSEWKYIDESEIDTFIKGINLNLHANNNYNGHY